VPVKELSGPTAEEDADGAAEGAVSELTVGRVKGGMEQEPGKAAPAERKEGQPRPDLPAGQGAAVKEAAAVEIKRSGAGDEAQAKDGAAAGQAVEKPQVAAAPKRKPEGLLVDEGEVAAKELQNRQSGAEARQAAKRSEEAASPQAVEQAAAQPPEEKLSAARPEPVVKLDEAVARPVAGVANVPQAGVSPQAPAAKATALPALPPEAGFAEANHGRIVTGIRTELLPNGGTMQIRLDPPELGALQVRIEMRDGIVSASFQTSSDDATRLLSHSLHQLKQTLESQGVSVEKLQVEQAPRERQGGAGDGGQQAGGRDAASQQQEQQRREMLERMWRRLQRGGDPLDLLG
jgi:flagellar hook-length control protein FliK